MHRISFLFVIALFVLGSAAFGQKVLWRDGLVSFDGKPYLTYEITRVPGIKIYAYHPLGEEKTLFQAHFCTNWTNPGGDAYRHYYFPDYDLELILPSNRKYRFKLLLPKMVEAGVLDDAGEINDDALRQFVTQYHVPLPRAWGPRVHQFPVITGDRKTTHQWEYSKDYDQEKRKWK